MQLAPIVERLNVLSDFSGRVFVEANEEQAVTRVKQVAPIGKPAAIVFGPRETAEPSERIGGVEQKVKVRFMSLICSRYAGDEMKAYSGLDSLVAAARYQLLGWVPDAGYRELHLQNGGLLYTSPGQLLIWGDTYETFFYIHA